MKTLLIKIYLKGKCNENKLNYIKLQINCEIHVIYGKKYFDYAMFLLQREFVHQTLQSLASPPFCQFTSVCGCGQTMT
jgi:hypothetical protein